MLNPLDLALKFLIGGSVVAAVSVLSRAGLAQQAGIAMTFPIITATSLFVVDNSQVTELVKAGLFGLILSCIFILSFFGLYKLGLAKGISITGAAIVEVIGVAAFVRFVSPFIR